MNKQILIVDDETNVRLNFRMALETEGYEIFEAHSAEQALEVLASHSFALAILDMRLPGMDGLELLEKMRERGNRVPAMVLMKALELNPKSVEAFNLAGVLARDTGGLRQSEKVLRSGDQARQKLRTGPTEHAAPF